MDVSFKRKQKKKKQDTNLQFCSSCASFVGLKGGEQPVFVGPQCMVGNTAHEILHALGFHHEHTRMDREQHITVIHSNIMPGKGSPQILSVLFKRYGS